MINILEKGELEGVVIPIFKKRCPHCTTLFEFAPEDMRSHNRGFGNYIGTVRCPICEAELPVYYEDVDRRVAKKE